MGSLGLYISVPFCRSKCTYCNFASGVYPAGLQEQYVARVCLEIQSARKRASGWGVELPAKVDSVYWGGGTPSVLTPRQTRELWGALREEFEITKTAENTLECAPGQLADEVLEAVIECGVNRISFGVQSFVDKEAAVTGRLHTREIALADIARVRSAGMAQVNVDLIAGLPYQSAATWQESLDVLAGTAPEHASVYMLEVDEDSRLGKELLGGGGRYHAHSVPGDELTAELYETAILRLEQLGLHQYEISNFARAGSESRHNERYWRRQAYWGFGLDAHSMLRRQDGSALRFDTSADLNEYLGLSGLVLPERSSMIPPEITHKTELRTPLKGMATLTQEEEMEEAWFLGLRLREGVRWSELVQQFGNHGVERFRPIVDELCGLDLLNEHDGAVRLTRQGMLFSNDVFARFIGVPETEPLAV
jgi:oxygen-independent coproporphyrinogen-3 oxidase